MVININSLEAFKNVCHKDRKSKRISSWAKPKCHNPKQNSIVHVSYPSDFSWIYSHEQICSQKKRLHIWSHSLTSLQGGKRIRLVTLAVAVQCAKSKNVLFADWSMIINHNKKINCFFESGLRITRITCRNATSREEIPTA